MVLETLIISAAVTICGSFVFTYKTLRAHHEQQRYDPSIRKASFEERRKILNQGRKVWSDRMDAMKVGTNCAKELAKMAEFDDRLIALAKEEAE